MQELRLCKKCAVFGQIIDAQGIIPDPAKDETIQQFKKPNNVKKLHGNG